MLSIALVHIHVHVFVYMCNVDMYMYIRQMEALKADLVVQQCDFSIYTMYV